MQSHPEIIRTKRIETNYHFKGRKTVKKYRVNCTITSDVWGDDEAPDFEDRVDKALFDEMFRSGQEYAKNVVENKTYWRLEDEI
jgi:hypothetical protein